MFSPLNGPTILLNAVNSVVSSESTEVICPVEVPAREPISAAASSPLGKMPVVGIAKNAGQSDTQWMLMLPGPCAQSPSTSRISSEASPLVVALVSLMKLTAPVGAVGPISTVNDPSGLTTSPWSSSRLSLLTPPSR